MSERQEEMLWFLGCAGLEMALATGHIVNQPALVFALFFLIVALINRLRSDK